MFDFINPRGYNKPIHVAMLLSQWAHQLFLWDMLTWERYIAVQNWAYRNRGE